MKIEEIKNFKVAYYQIAKEIPEILGSGSDYHYIQQFTSYENACDSYNLRIHNHFQCTIYTEEYSVLQMWLSKDEKDVFKNVDWYTTYLFYPKTHKLCRVTASRN